jgi:3-hydroxy-9,10-secoandrosta-1,3,5(10)-triene-9,17-dione monooxygenase
MQVSKPGHEFPGLKVHGNPMFRVPTSAMGGYGIGGCMVGNARAMLQESIDWIKSRSTSYTAAKMRDFPTVQLRIGMAAAKIDAAHAWMKSDCLEAFETLKSGGTLDVETKLRYKRNSAIGVKLAHEAVDMLHELAGANGIYDKYSIQRMFRDAHAAAGHFSFSTDAMLTPWGLAALGGEVKSPTL